LDEKPILRVIGPTRRFYLRRKAVGERCDLKGKEELNGSRGFAVKPSESHLINYNNLTIWSTKDSIPNPPIVRDEAAGVAVGGEEMKTPLRLQKAAGDGLRTLCCCATYPMQTRLVYKLCKLLLQSLYLHPMTRLRGGEFIHLSPAANTFANQNSP
jgi:hypothetical protein